MAKQYSPSWVQRQIAARLKYWREEIAGNPTADEVAKQAGWSATTQSRLENAKMFIKGTHISRLGYVLKIPFDDVDKLNDRWEAERARVGELQGVAPDALDAGFRDWVQIESMARRIRTFQNTYPPGLFQPRAAGLAIARATAISRQSDDVGLEQAIDLRVRRQERLLDPDFSVTAIIAESVLHTNLGGVTTTRKQRRRLLEVAELPAVNIHVLTPDAGIPPIGVGFSIASFEEGDPDAVYVELLDGGVIMEDPDKAGWYTLAFKRLLSMAKEPEESLAMIKAIDSKE